VCEKFKAHIENQTRRKIKEHRTHNGLEFYESEFNKFYAPQVMTRHKTFSWETSA